jgi:hypothetical protein
LGIGCNDFIATTKPTKAVAEREVEVELELSIFRIRSPDTFLQSLIIKRLGKCICRWVGSVPGSFFIVLLDEVHIYFESIHD